MEVPVRKILMGVSGEKAANRSSRWQSPGIGFFIDYVNGQTDYVLG